MKENQEENSLENFLDDKIQSKAPIEDIDATLDSLLADTTQSEKVSEPATNSSTSSPIINTAKETNASLDNLEEESSPTEISATLNDKLSDTSAPIEGTTQITDKSAEVSAETSPLNVENKPISQSNGTDALPRPKLKKIKRLKIRPMSDVPVAPTKVSPDINDTPQPVDDDFKDEIPEEIQNTSLITTDTNDISSGNEFDNSYVLEGLPPELDYVTGDDGEAYYPATGIMAYKKPLIIALGCFLFGMFLGAIFFSTKTEEHHGLEYVVLNPDVPQGRARCGLTDKSQACIFYIMNCYKQELTGRDFFKLAATLTGREEYLIETENLRYATIKIKPGAFAQLNIPSLEHSSTGGKR